MQKQKTIAKWLAIIMLCSVAVGSYLLYDALYVKKTNNQATADDVVNTPNNDDLQNGDEVDDTPPHLPYYTTLPRPYEVIDGIGVTHFGGEGDDTIHSVLNYGGKRMAIFSTNSVEFDVRQHGLSVAVIGDGVEEVKHLASATYIDGIMSSNGLLILTKNDDGGRVYLLDKSGDICGQLTLPEITNGDLYLSGGEVLLFYISKGYLYCNKILENMVVQTSPFMLKTDCDTLHQIFDTPLGQGLVAGASDTTKIYTFEHNKGFKLLFSQDKLLFKQIITAGTASSCNYVFLGISSATPTLISFDSAFQVVGVKTVTEATDGVIFPYGDGVCFQGNGICATYCKHLDQISEITTSLTFENVVSYLPTRQGFIIVVSDESGAKLILADGEILTEKALDFAGEIVGISATSKGFSILVNTPSTLGVFRGNFGGVDPYVLDFDLSFFDRAE